MPNYHPNEAICTNKQHTRSPWSLFQRARGMWRSSGVVGCRNGASCSYLREGRCDFQHSEEDQTMALLRRKPVEERTLLELAKNQDP